MSTLSSCWHHHDGWLIAQGRPVDTMDHCTNMAHWDKLCPIESIWPTNTSYISPPFRLLAHVWPWQVPSLVQQLPFFWNSMKKSHGKTRFSLYKETSISEPKLKRAEAAKTFLDILIGDAAFTLYAVVYHSLKQCNETIPDVLDRSCGPNDANFTIPRAVVSIFFHCPLDCSTLMNIWLYFIMT